MLHEELTAELKDPASLSLARPGWETKLSYKPLSAVTRLLLGAPLSLRSFRLLFSSPQRRERADGAAAASSDPAPLPLSREESAAVGTGTSRCSSARGQGRNLLTGQSTAADYSDSSR